MLERSGYGGNRGLVVVRLAVSFERRVLPVDTKNLTVVSRGCCSSPTYSSEWIPIGDLSWLGPNVRACISRNGPPSLKSAYGYRRSGLTKGMEMTMQCLASIGILEMPGMGRTRCVLSRQGFLEGVYGLENKR